MTADEEPTVVTDVELVLTDALQPYNNNPKEHPSEQIDAIAESIQNSDGFDVPIVAHHRDSGVPEIIKGHGRVQAAQQLGLAKVPVIWRDDMSDEQIRAARIADNKTQMESGFDFDALEDEFTELEMDFEIETESLAMQTGFEADIVEDLTANDDPSADDLFETDDTDDSSADDDTVADDDAEPIDTATATDTEIDNTSTDAETDSSSTDDTSTDGQTNETDASESVDASTSDAVDTGANDAIDDSDNRSDTTDDDDSNGVTNTDSESDSDTQTVGDTTCPECGHQFIAE
jgi:ParB/RepB/Spo0J family partition protein